MKKVQLTLNEGSGGATSRNAVSINDVMAGRTNSRRQTEDLRMKVLDMAERHMDVTVQVLKKWLN